MEYHFIYIIITAVVAFTAGFAACTIWEANKTSKDPSSYKDEIESGVASIKAYVKELTDKK